MSCDAVAFAATLWLSSFDPSAQALGAQPAMFLRTANAPLPRVSSEPMYRDIVKQAKSLKGEVNAYLKAGEKVAPSDPAWALVNFDAFKQKVGALSELDMKGHLDLKARNLDGDLKCILRGISQDLPKRLDEVAAAKDARSQSAALKELSYLLNDNVEVITAPPQPPA
jgi:hypothetical protein